MFSRFAKPLLRLSKPAKGSLVFPLILGRSLLPMSFTHNDTIFAKGTPLPIPLQHSVSAPSTASKLVLILRSLIRGLYLVVLWTPSLFIGTILLLSSKISPHSSPTLSIANTFWKYNLFAARSSGACTIKFLQWASTRRDLFPSSFCNHFEELCDRASHKPFAYFKHLMNAQMPKWQKYLDVEEEPIGSGCVANVYKATFTSDSGERRQVAIKLIDPFVKKVIEADLNLLKGVSWLLECFPGVQCWGIHESVKEFDILMSLQVDLRVEAKHLVEFAHNFRDFPEVSFPRPVPGWISENVLVESFEHGTSMGQILNPPADSENSLSDHQRTVLAGIGLQSLLKMIFVDNLIHGDLHPGNMLVNEHGIVFLDVGITACLEPQDKKNLVDLFHAVASGEGMRAGELLVKRSKGSRCEDIEGFSNGVDDIVQKALGTDLRLGRLQLGNLLGDVLQLCWKYQVQLDPSFASIVISMIMIEGIGRSLDPDLNILEAAFPIISQAFFSLR